MDSSECLRVPHAYFLNGFKLVGYIQSLNGLSLWCVTGLCVCVRMRLSVPGCVKLQSVCALVQALFSAGVCVCVCACVCVCVCLSLSYIRECLCGVRTVMRE